MFKNGRRKEADFGAKKHFRLVTSAATGLATILELTLSSDAALRVFAKTSAEQEAYFKQNGPHPDPLPSDGRGNSQTGRSQLPKRLDTPTDAGRFSLSHPMGEGRAFAAPPPSRRSGRFGAPRRRKRLRPRRRGEGEFASKSEVVFARVLRNHARQDALRPIYEDDNTKLRS